MPSTSWFRMWLVASLVAVVASMVPAASAAPVALTYQAPVPGPVTRGFEAPVHRYAEGHRGVDLGVAVGDEVRSAAAGTVAHAGPVAGEVWVTVTHGDGVRTSYGELTELRVRSGDQVARGAVLGRATGRHRSTSGAPDAGLHWSARRGEDYLDPLTLLAPPRASLVGPGRWWASAPVVVPYQPYEPGRFLAGSSPVATRPGYGVPPNHHHALLVPGFATEGPHDLFDPAFLAYGAHDASRFSYGGCDPSPRGCEPRPYGGRDTHLEVVDAAALLADHLRGRQREQPWRPVDLLGHSMGGDVIAHYLEHVHDPADPTLPPLGSVVTYGTPHRGSGVAFVGRALSDSLIGSVAGESLLSVGRLLGVAGAERLALDVPPVRRYGGYRGPSRDTARLGDLGVDLHTFGGSRDLVVAPGRATPAGHPVTVLPGSHGGMLRTEAAMQATRAVLAGADPVGADGRAVGVGPGTVDVALRGVGVVVDVLDVGGKYRLVRQGLVGARRFATGEKRHDEGSEERIEEPG